MFDVDLAGLPIEGDTHFESDLCIGTGVGGKIAVNEAMILCK
jgi:hypothetical protein